jgi:hypothetical protein
MTPNTQQQQDVDTRVGSARTAGVTEAVKNDKPVGIGDITQQSSKHNVNSISHQQQEVYTRVGSARNAGVSSVADSAGSSTGSIAGASTEIDTAASAK